MINEPFTWTAWEDGSRDRDKAKAERRNNPTMKGVKPVSRAYRDGWDAAFGKRRKPR